MPSGPPSPALTAPASPRNAAGLALLRGSLVCGALYDLAFAAAMLAAPEIPARLLALPLPPLPEGAFYLWLLAILLSMLAGLYLVAAAAPRRHGAIIAIAAGGRLAGALAFFVAARRHAALAGLYPLAGADLAFGVTQLLGGWSLRSPLRPRLRPGSKHL